MSKCIIIQEIWERQQNECGPRTFFTQGSGQGINVAGALHTAKSLLLCSALAAGESGSKIGSGGGLQRTWLWQQPTTVIIEIW